MQKRITLVLVVLLLAAGARVHAQKTFLWQVSGKDLKKSSYLFGTYHLLNAGYLEKLPKVQKALDESEAVMIEVDADSMAMMQAMMPAMMMKDTLLSDLIDSAEYNLVSNELRNVMNAPPQVIDRLKPAALYFVLTLTYAREANPELAEFEGPPMDFYFAQEARTDGKRVMGLETVQDQVNMTLNQRSLKNQAELLVRFVKKDKGEQLEEARELTGIYLNNEFNEILPLTEKYAEEYGEDMTSMLDERNMRWIPAIEKAIGEQATFIAVGAAHMPGENGVIELLRDKGYKVKPVKH